MRLLTLDSPQIKTRILNASMDTPYFLRRSKKHNIFNSFNSNQNDHSYNAHSIRKYICAVVNGTSKYAVIDTYQILIKYNIIEDATISTTRAKKAWNEFVYSISHRLSISSQVRIYSSDGKELTGFNDITNNKIIIIAPYEEQFKGINKCLYESLANSKSLMSPSLKNSSAFSSTPLRKNKILPPIIKIDGNDVRKRISRLMKMLMIQFKLSSLRMIQLKSEFLCLDKLADTPIEGVDSFKKLKEGISLDYIYPNILLFGGKPREQIKKILELAGISTSEMAKINFEEYIRLRLNIDNYMREISAL